MQMPAIAISTALAARGLLVEEKQPALVELGGDWIRVVLAHKSDLNQRSHISDMPPLNLGRVYRPLSRQRRAVRADAGDACSDTTFLVAAEVIGHSNHAASRSRLAALRSAGDDFAIAPQVLAEYCTRRDRPEPIFFTAEHGCGPFSGRKLVEFRRGSAGCPKRSNNGRVFRVDEGAPSRQKANSRYAFSGYLQGGRELHGS